MRDMDKRYAKRNAAIRAQFTSGDPMQDVADRHNISKARVQQILKQMGLSAADGGLARRMAERKKRKAGK